MNLENPLLDRWQLFRRQSLLWWKQVLHRMTSLVNQIMEWKMDFNLNEKKSSESGDGSGYVMKLRSGLSVYPSQDTSFEHLLSDLMQKASARFVILTDTTGQVICEKGFGQSNNLTSLGALIAGDLAASQEIARLTGEFEPYQMVIREGQRSNTIIVGAGRDLILVSQISSDVPLGWARLHMLDSAQRLAEVLKSAPTKDDLAQPFELDLDDKGLSDLFNNALDEIWEE